MIFSKQTTFAQVLVKEIKNSNGKQKLLVTPDPGATPYGTSMLFRFLNVFERFDGLQDDFTWYTIL